MKKFSAMPIFWDEYIADTAHLKTEEHGAYLLLLAAMWRRGGWVADQDDDNARIVGLSLSKWQEVKARLLPFFIFEDGQISQKRLLSEYEKIKTISEARSKAGKKGGRPSKIGIAS